MTTDSKLPNNIRRWRRALGMTQPELAAAVGESARAISAWELGISRPKRYSVIVRIATALGVEPGALGVELEELGIPPDGSPLWRLRELRGLTLRELAEMIGVSAQQVSKWERGKSQPGTDYMIACIATALGVEPEELGLQAYYSDARKTPPAGGGVQS